MSFTRRTYNLQFNKVASTTLFCIFKKILIINQLRLDAEEEQEGSINTECKDLRFQHLAMQISSIPLNFTSIGYTCFLFTPTYRFWTSSQTTKQYFSVSDRAPAANKGTLSRYFCRVLRDLAVSGKDRRKLKIPRRAWHVAAPAALCNYQQCNQRTH